jgi:hypothetical protein
MADAHLTFRGGLLRGGLACPLLEFLPDISQPGQMEFFKLAVHSFGVLRTEIVFVHLDNFIRASVSVMQNATGC